MVVIGSGTGGGVLYVIVLNVVGTGSGTGGGVLYVIVLTVVGTGSGIGVGIGVGISYWTGVVVVTVLYVVVVIGSGTGGGVLYVIVFTVVGAGGGVLYVIVLTVVDTGSGTGIGTKDCEDGPVVVVVVVYSPKSKGVDSILSNVNPVSTTGLDTTFVTLVSFGVEYSNWVVGIENVS